MDTCTECTAVHCKHCTSMDECAGCHQTFCMPGEGSPDADCAQECVGPGCDFVLCPSCAWFCQNCNAVLCEDCARSCGRCGVVVCAEDDKFLVGCEGCKVPYCLACMALKEPCLRCAKVPGKRIQKMVHLRLKTIYQAMGDSGSATLQARKPLFGPASHSFAVSAAAASAGVAAATSASIHEHCGTRDSGDGAQQCAGTHTHSHDHLHWPADFQELAAGSGSGSVSGSGSARGKWQQPPATVDAKKVAADASAIAKAAVKAQEAEAELINIMEEEEERQLQKKNKKKKKKGKKKGASPEDEPILAAEAGEEPQPSDGKPATRGDSSNGDASVGSPGSAQETSVPSVAENASAEERQALHKQLLEFVRSVLLGKVVASADDVRRQFSGRMSADVIADVLAQAGDDTKAAVDSCADILCIDVSHIKDEVAEHESAARALALSEEEEEEQEEEEEEEEEEDDEEEDAGSDVEPDAELDEEVQQAAPADPLEARLKEAVAENDLEGLQWVLDAVKGQPGQSSIRKTAKKHIKRLLQAQDEQRKRQQHKQKSEPPPPRAQSPPPTYSSYAPPRIAGQKPGFVMDLDVSIVGWVIGKNGARIKEMQAQSGAKMWVDQNLPDGRPLPEDTPRKLFIHGTEGQVAAAKEQVTQLLKQAPGYLPPTTQGQAVGSNADAPVLAAAAAAAAAATAAKQSSAEKMGGSSNVGGSSSAEGGGERVTKVIDCPSNYVGLLIGRKGWTIKNIQQQSGAHVTVNQNVPDDRPRKIVLVGTPETVSHAESLVMDVLSYPADPPPAGSSTATVSSGGGTAVAAPPPTPAPPQPAPSAWGQQAPHLVHTSPVLQPSPSPGAQAGLASPPTSIMPRQQASPSVSSGSSPPSGLGRGGSAVDRSALQLPAETGGQVQAAIGRQKGDSASHQRPISPPPAIELDFRMDSDMQMESNPVMGNLGQPLHSGGGDLWGAFSGLGSGGGGGLSTVLGLGSMGPGPLFASGDVPTVGAMGQAPGRMPTPPPHLGSIDGSFRQHSGASVVGMLTGNRTVSQSHQMAHQSYSDMGASSKSANSVDSLAGFLSSLGLEKYTDLLLQHEIGLEECYMMEDKDFADVGLPKGARVKIISTLRRGGSATHAQGPPPPHLQQPQQHMPDLNDPDGIDDILGVGSGSEPCVICWLKPVECVFIPCGHVAVCLDCCKLGQEGLLRECPICRGEIAKINRVYI
jgi:hypothetical protein